MRYLKPTLVLLAMVLPTCGAAAETWRVRVGAGAEVRPEFPGADSMEISPYPEVSVARGEEAFGLGAPDDSFDIKLVSSGGFSAGLDAALSQPRADSDVGSPVGDVSRTVEVGGFVQHMLGESFRVRAEARQALGGHDGLVGSLGADYFARDADRWTFSIGPRVRFADSDYMDAYFGVRPEVSILTLLPVYDPDGGVKAIGAISGFTYSLGGPFGLYGFARYDRLVGDAKDSPIVETFGSPNQFSAGLGLSYIFNIKL